MGVRSLCTWAIALPLAAAFQNTSPFFLASTSSLDISNIPTSLQTSKQLWTRIDDSVTTGCPSDYYLLISHPGVSSTDLENEDVAPFMKQLIMSDGDRYSGRIQSSVAIHDVYGALDVDSLQSSIRKSCGSAVAKVDNNGHVDFNSLSTSKSHILRWDLSELPTGQNRFDQLRSRDQILETVISSLPEDRSFTVVYTSTPPSSKRLSLSSQSDDTDAESYGIPTGLHTQLRRIVTPVDGTKKDSNEKTDSNEGLFERYTFLSPGLIMGLLISFFLFMLLYLAISTIANIEVAYFAFSPQANPTKPKQHQ